ncbi:hypothetical protein [Sphingobacterium athyrii]|uniref:glycosyl-4,4'-diaponeurosporenoate acyltransferase CrtO family protein n=1 Tax=Sphingobacterium athyrii TaxID=2152717 RepID=UPI001C6392E4
MRSYEIIVTFVINIILHVYSILLQRFNRPRLERVLKLSKRNRTVNMTTSPNQNGTAAMLDLDKGV